MSASKQLVPSRDEIADLLTAVFTLCYLDPSLNAGTLERLIVQSRHAAKKRASTLRQDRKSIFDFDALGHVVYIWQRSPRYLDNEGQPMPLKSRGPAPSIQALFREVKRGDYFVQGLKDLVHLKRIQRSGSRHYLPCSEVTIVDELTPEFVRQLTQSMNRLVSTVLFNTSQQGSKAPRLVERMTCIPDLPLKQVNAFKKFAREQGGALINTMNDWLESRRGVQKARTPRSSRHLTAGLHVFSFVERNRR